MDEERVFSLSYEQLTRFAEKRIRECNWTARARFISASQPKPEPC